MKHGRRHDKLKEGVYRDLFRRRAEGYASDYRPMPVAEPEDPKALPEPASEIELRLRGKAKKGIERALRDESRSE
ncbi:MAG TPA: hypothetical protein VM370_10455 [Candidatus Thermoplasmatota archaeon]|nr:hypothetical protein [Candidatus Thermoplasmatota archaeon]